MWQPMDDFPDGLFPEGAFDYVFYQGHLYAEWQARYDERSLWVQVRVKHTHHLSDSFDIEKMLFNDAVCVALKGSPGDKICVVTATLRSDTGEAGAGFFKTANPDRYPRGLSRDIALEARRIGSETTYELKIDWPMVNLDSPPPAGTALPFSVMVPCRDPNAYYGLQWFYVIRFGPDEGREDSMGQLWVV